MAKKSLKSYSHLRAGRVVNISLAEIVPQASSRFQTRFGSAQEVAERRRLKANLVPTQVKPSLGWVFEHSVNLESFKAHLTYMPP